MAARFSPTYPFTSQITLLTSFVPPLSRTLPFIPTPCSSFQFQIVSSLQARPTLLSVTPTPSLQTLAGDGFRKCLLSHKSLLFFGQLATITSPQNFFSIIAKSLTTPTAPSTAQPPKLPSTFSVIALWSLTSSPKSPLTQWRSHLMTQAPPIFLKKK